MAPLFLIHEDAAGSRTVNKVSQTQRSRRYWLPNEFSENFELLADRNDTHSALCLDLSDTHALLSVWNDSLGTSVISADGREFLMPVSTNLHQKSFILRHDDQFVSAAGRWNLQYDDEHGTISNSMRPPQILGDDGLGTTTEPEFEDLPLPFNGDTAAQIMNPSLHAETVQSDEISPSHATLVSASVSNEVPVRHGINGSTNMEDGGSRSESHTHSRFEHISVTLPDDLRLQTCQQVDMPASMPEDASILGHCPETTQLLQDALSADCSAPPIKQSKDVHSHETAEQDELHNESLQDSQHSLATGPKKRKRSTQEKRHHNARHKKMRADSVSVEPVQIENDEEASMVDNTIQEILIEGQQHNVPVDSLSQKSVTACTPVRTTTRSKPTEVPSKISPNQDLDSIEPTPSSRTRAASHTSSSPAISLRLDVPLSIVFSSNTSIQKKKKAMTSLRDLGCHVVRSVGEADILCVADSPLKRTSKFVIAVATGKIIVTEKWIVECQRQRKFPDPARFLPQDPETEKRWGFKLAEAIERGRRLGSELTTLLSGWIVYLTPSLKKDLAGLVNELGDIALALRVENFFQKLPDKSHVNPHDSLVLGVPGDAHAAAVGRMGLPLYSKDLLTMAPLRGHLELESSEFRLHTPIKEEQFDD